MLTLQLIIRTAIDCYVLLLLLRAWLYAVLNDRYNPFYLLIVQWTQPMVKKCHRLIPPKSRLDISVIFLALALLVLRTFLLTWLQRPHSFGFSMINIGIGLLALLKLSGKLLFWVITLRIISSWIYRENYLLYDTLQQLSELILTPIRRWVPPTYGLDWSCALCTLLLILLNRLGYDLYGTLWGQL
ncbi:MAG: YggT family protein [Candidatus Symbiodolus clandestinus]